MATSLSFTAEQHGRSECWHDSIPNLHASFANIIWRIRLILNAVEMLVYEINQNKDAESSIHAEHILEDAFDKALSSQPYGCFFLSNTWLLHK